MCFFVYYFYVRVIYFLCSACFVCSVCFCLQVIRAFTMVDKFIPSYATTPCQKLLVALKISYIGGTQISYVSYTQSHLHRLHSSRLRQFHPKLATSVTLKVSWHSNQLCQWNATRMDRDLWLICCESQ